MPLIKMFASINNTHHVYTYKRVVVNATALKLEHKLVAVLCAKKYHLQRVVTDGLGLGAATGTVMDVGNMTKIAAN